MSRKTVEIEDEEVWRKARVYALSQGETMGHVITESLREYVDELRDAKDSTLRRV